MSCEHGNADVLSVCDAACRRYAVANSALPTALPNDGGAAPAGLPGAAPRAAPPIGGPAGSPAGGGCSIAAIRRRDVQHAAVPAPSSSAAAAAPAATVLFGRCDWTRLADVLLEHKLDEVESVAAFAAQGLDSETVNHLHAGFYGRPNHWLAMGTAEASFACSTAMAKSVQDLPLP